jgi:hypothetical protein
VGDHAGRITVPATPTSSDTPQRPAPGTDGTRAGWRRDAPWMIAILVATFALWSPSLGNRFAMDDRDVAMATYDSGRPNPMVNELQPLPEYFASHYWRGRRETSELYRPVTILSYALVRAAAGGQANDEARQALPQHLLNVLLHVVATALVWALVAGLFGPGRPALAAAAVFGLHALRSEVVAGVAGRAELLAFVLGCAALLFGQRACAGRGLRLGPALAALALQFLALGSKESAAAWSLLLPIAVAARRLGARAVLLALALGLLPLVPFLWLRHGVVTPPGPDNPLVYLVNPLAHVTALARVVSGVANWGLGLYKTLVPSSWPWPLASDWGVACLPIVESPLDVRFLVAATALVALAAGSIILWRRQPLIGLAAASFLLPSAITSNVPFAIGTVFGERLYYAPALGLSLALPWLLRCRAGWLGLGLWLIASIVAALPRTTVWRDNETLFLTDVRVQPRSARLQMMAGLLSRDPAQRRSHLERAVELFPQYPDALNNLANDCLKSDVPRSEALLRQALASPHLDEKRHGFIRHNLLGLLLMTGRLEAASPILDTALEQATPADHGSLLGLAEAVAAGDRRVAARLLLDRLATDDRVAPALRQRAAARARELR